VAGPDIRLDEQDVKRGQIERELNNSALQDFCIAFLHLDAAIERIPQQAPAHPPLDNCLELMRRGIDESRRTLKGLRSPGSATDDLVLALKDISRELGAASRCHVGIVVKGRSRELNPVVREEVYRIGHEALANAFRHSNATQVEIEIGFATKYLKLMVRDSGRGMDSRRVLANLHQYPGLLGMHERAKRIGVKLEVWSKRKSGTEIALTVPCSIAFKSQDND
jgi:signal transduction histidine kinase